MPRPGSAGDQRDDWCGVSFCVPSSNGSNGEPLTARDFAPCLAAAAESGAGFPAGLLLATGINNAQSTFMPVRSISDALGVGKSDQIPKVTPGASCLPVSCNWSASVLRARSTNGSSPSL